MNNGKWHFQRQLRRRDNQPGRRKSYLLAVNLPIRPTADRGGRADFVASGNRNDGDARYYKFLNAEGNNKENK